MKIDRKKLIEQAAFYGNKNLLKLNQDWEIGMSVLLNVVKSDNVEACGALKDFLDQKSWLLDEDTKREIIKRGKANILSLFELYQPQLKEVQHRILGKIPKSEEFPYFNLNKLIII